MTEVELSALVVGITEIVKKFGLPSRWCPVFAVVLGLILSCGDTWYHGEANWYHAILRGILVGVATTGTYAAVDRFVMKSKQPA
ncbi:MAG: holin [Candidatus Gracilibacteria bacterium]|nr:holin [Candidatus Gracilibacteria bacterium]